MDLKIKMSLNNIDLWEKIIYDLNGSCDSLEQALAEHDAEDLEHHEPFLHHLDDQIFRCDCCGWWYPISEMAITEEAQICDDCYSQGSDD